MTWMKKPEAISRKWCQCMDAKCKGRCVSMYVCGVKFGDYDSICLLHFGG